jgi:hypothetical protein
VVEREPRRTFARVDREHRRADPLGAQLASKDRRQRASEVIPLDDEPPRAVRTRDRLDRLDRVVGRHDATSAREVLEASGVDREQSFLPADAASVELGREGEARLPRRIPDPMDRQCIGDRCHDNEDDDRTDERS